MPCGFIFSIRDLLYRFFSFVQMVLGREVMEKEVLGDGADLFMESLLLLDISRDYDMQN